MTTNAIGVDNKVLESVLNRLDDQLGMHISLTRGSESGYSYRLPRCRVRIREGGSMSWREEHVATRVLSPSTLTFVIGRFTHPGNPCEVQLISQFGSWSDIKGVLHDCRHIQGALHEAVLIFDKSIEPSDFCTADCHSSVLIVDNDSSSTRLAAHFLNECGAIVETASSGPDAISLVGSKSPDAILMDIDMPGMDGLEATRALRESGYRGYIVAHTSTATSESDCMAAGCDAFFQKPVPKSGFAQLLSRFRKEPIISDMHNERSFKDIIDAYVQELPSQLEKLHAIIDQGDAGTIDFTARSMSACAVSHGFGEIAEGIQAIIALIDSAKPQDMKHALADLTDMAARVRGPSAY